MLSADLDPSNEPEPGSSRTTIVAGIAVALVAVVALVLYLMPGGKPARTASPAPAPKATPAAPAPAPAATAAVETPAPEAARPRAKKKVEARAPAPAPEPAAPTAGELKIESDVAGAMVFIDRKYIGNTPVTAKDVAPGRHQLNLTADGYDGYSESIEVVAGPGDVMVRFKEIRLDQKVDVVHKHTMGSCEGRLVADPQGIRYETTNKNDAFVLKFSEIETFDVDYLNKNLRLKKRGGKQYNFTTKAANADPLFVFHRDVDKVRKQVAGGSK
jgi:hypothetical protein